MSSYAPGKAARPKSVQTAVMLIWASIVLGLISAVITFLNLDDSATSAAGTAIDQQDAGGAVLAGGVIGLLIGVGIPIILAIFIGKGHNWARIVYTVLAAIGILFGLLGLIGAAALGTVTLIVQVISLALSIAILFFLFRPDANAYFKS